MPRGRGICASTAGRREFLTHASRRVLRFAASRLARQPDSIYSHVRRRRTHRDFFSRVRAALLSYSTERSASLIEAFLRYTATRESREQKSPRDQTLGKHLRRRPIYPERQVAWSYIAPPAPRDERFLHTASPVRLAREHMQSPLRVLRCARPCARDGNVLWRSNAMAARPASTVTTPQIIIKLLLNSFRTNAAPPAIRRCSRSGVITQQIARPTQDQPQESPVTLVILPPEIDGMHACRMYSTHVSLPNLAVLVQ